MMVRPIPKLRLCRTRDALPVRTRLHGFDSCRSFRWDAKTNGRLDEAPDPTQSIHLESSKFDRLSADGRRRCAAGSAVACTLATVAPFRPARRILNVDVLGSF